MSALEVIEQIKALPPDERAAVVEFVHKMEAASLHSSGVRYVDRPTLEATADKIFDRYDDLFRRLAQ